MNVNPLMTVWLLSCIISYPDLTGAVRNSNLKRDKIKHEASELSTLYGKGESLASFRFDFLKLLAVEKKKKNKFCDTKATTESKDSSSCITSSTAKNKKGSKTTKQASEYYDESCSGSLSSTAKNKKGTKKIKTQSTKSSQGSDSNGNDINAGSNKWKKIQKFFFFPPNWSLTRSYKAYETTTTEAKHNKLRPMQITQHPKGGMVDHTKITDATYLYPIPVITNDQYKDNLLLKEDVIKKNATNEENISSKGQMIDVGTTDSPSTWQRNEFEKIPSYRFYEGDVITKEAIRQEWGYNTITSLGPMEGTTSFQQDTLLSIPWYMNPEKIPSKQELLGSDAMPFTEGGNLNSQNLPNEATDTRINYQTNREIYNYENTPSTNQIESIDNVNYNNKATLYTDIFQTSNTINEINQPINHGRFRLKPEEITDNTKEKYEVSMIRKDPKLSFKPEATIELEQPPNQTSMENRELSYKQNREKMANKWKHIFSSIEPEYEQFKNVYRNIINHHVTEKDLFTSIVENSFDKLIKPNFNDISNIHNESNMTDFSNPILEAFSNFLKKDVPKLFTHHSLENLHGTTQQPLYDLDKYSDPNLKQYFFLNTETKLTTEDIRNNPSHVQVNGEKPLTPNFDSDTLFEKPTIDYLQKMETKLFLKDGSLQQKPGQNISTTPSPTIIQQYSIEMWPKYTEKTDYNLDYISTTQSSVNTQWLTEESAYTNFQNELSPTRTARISSTETTEGIEKSFESKESPKGVGFEALLTIPLIFTDKDSEIQSELSSTEVTMTKNLGHQSILNLTLNPIIFNNLWGIQSFLNESSNEPISTKLDRFQDDKISFDNRHEFNAEHHLQSTTSQPFFSNPTSFEWAPFNIPTFRNEFDIFGTSTFKISELNQDYTKEGKDTNEPLIELFNKNKMSMIEKNKIRNFTLQPNYKPLSSDLNAGNLLLLNNPHEKLEPLRKMHKYVSRKSNLINDPVWNEIIYQTKFGTENNEPSVKDFTQSEELPDRNKIYQSLKKPSFLEEKIRGDNLKNILPFPEEKVTNKGRDGIGKFLDEAVLRNIKKIELMAPTKGSRKFDKIEEFKNEIDEVVTKSMMKDPKTRNNFWSNLNASSGSETKELNESTNKYEQTNTEGNDEFSENLKDWPLLESQRTNLNKGNGDKVDLQPVINNELLTKQTSVSSLYDSKPAHNEQNEKLLASEKSFDGQLSMPSSLPVNSQKQNNFDYLKNNIGMLKNFMNNSLPERKNNSDVNKNEFSAIQMSAIKIFNKKPEMFEPPLYNSIKSIFDQNDNNTEINHEMSRMLWKMQDFANKFGMKKVLLKRGITVPQNNLFESTGSWGNKCSVFPFKTENIPYNTNYSPEIEMSPLNFNSAIKNIHPDKISGKWKYNMQSMIDKWNKKRSLHSNIYDNDVQEYSESLLSNVVNTELKCSESQNEPLGNYLGNKLHQSPISSDDNYEQFFTGDIKEKLKRNVVGNKKMKSRELEFILDRNLPRLPLNKRLFIAYMMTGLKSPGNSIASEDERHLQLSKANIQNLIDRNIKKEKLVEFTSKRSRKKQWRTNNFS